jgi:hypothetical protein
MNLSCVFRFLEILREKMQNPALKEQKMIYYVGNTAQKRSNGVFLLGCYLVLEARMSCEEVCHSVLSVLSTTLYF